MFTLSRADDGQAQARDAATYDAWGERLTREQYYARERALRAQRWARSAIATWLMRDEQGDVVASCETFRSSMTWSDRGSAQHGAAYGVASVYTEPARRSRGHASRMIEMLREGLRETNPSAQAIYLFSDIGTRFYERARYVARPALEYVAPAAFRPGIAPDEVFPDTPHDAARLLALFAAPASGCVIWPTVERLDWHVERARIYAAALHRSPLASIGARAGGAALAWAADFKRERLVVLLARAGTPSDNEAVFSAARDVAAAARLGDVCVWHEPNLLPPAPFALRTRDDAIPMLCPLARGIEPDAWTHIPRCLWI